MRTSVRARAELPELPLSDWEPTKTTLHLWLQIVGKIRLAATPSCNHWWNAPLYVDVRGLTTRRMHADGVSFQIDFDFIEHALVVRTSRGETVPLPLYDGLSVAEFDANLHAILADLGVHVEIREQPFGMPITTPFRADREHASYDADCVARFWWILDWSDDVFVEFAGWFSGKTSPVHLFWHSFDLAVTRFSGGRAPPLPEADSVTREAYSHEVISFGFWPGDQKVREPAYYSYTAPEPAALRSRRLRPEAAYWQQDGALALLPYEVVRSAENPRKTLLAFLQSAYDAGSTAAGWDREGLRSSWSPTAEELEELVRGS
jgi:Family of unknown function (DUF5996)